jgi:exopolysaccharide biosynthesis polyprenyl glycosylphosphotransferase
LIVGAGPAGQEVAAYLAQHPELGRRVRGFLDNSSVPALGVLGSIENIATIARAEFVDEVILAVPHRRDLTQFVIREARKNRLDVKVVPDLFGCEIRNPWIETVGNIPLVTLHQEELPVAGLFAKRALDIAVSAFALTFSLPLTLLIALLIRLDSRGPVTYAALRVGRKGNRFPCYKFRTMVANANEIKESLRQQNQREGPCFKISNDPRITRVGRWLRRYSLDELPQLWNVLRGDMSLVGPRPHPVDDFARYRLEHLRRLDVTPGITGLWQVTARGCPSFHTNMALDLEYIERWSLGLDLRILLKTISVVVHGTGA